jgi:hypothetical protein
MHNAATIAGMAFANAVRGGAPLAGRCAAGSGAAAAARREHGPPP